jgi:hypothetical protein
MRSGLLAAVGDYMAKQRRSPQPLLRWMVTLEVPRQAIAVSVLAQTIGEAISVAKREYPSTQHVETKLIVDAGV